MSEGGHEEHEEQSRSPFSQVTTEAGDSLLIWMVTSGNGKFDNSSKDRKQRHQLNGQLLVNDGVV